MEIFLYIRYNFIEDDNMDTNEIKRELLKYQERVNDLWRSL